MARNLIVDEFNYKQARPTAGRPRALRPDMSLMRIPAPHALLQIAPQLALEALRHFLAGLPSSPPRSS